jgi:purine-nucleoside phosphorylase
MITREQLDKAVAALPQEFLNDSPKLGLMLGSYWKEAVAELKVSKRVSFSQIPGLGAATVEGHSGEILLAENPSGKEPLVIFSGRRHFYEEASKLPLAVMAYLLKAANVHSVLLTNSAGSLRSIPPGDFMLISDHINQIEDAFLAVERGVFSEQMFNSMYPLYDGDYRRAFIQRVQHKLGFSINEGTYLGITGPSFETGREVAWYGSFAHAVGMSTVIEASLLHAAGIKVLGLSCMTNWGAGKVAEPLSHEDVRRTLSGAIKTAKALVSIGIEVMSGD